MEHFDLYLPVSIYFMVALGLPRRFKAAPRWETLDCVTENLAQWEVSALTD